MKLGGKKKSKKVFGVPLQEALALNRSSGSCLPVPDVIVDVVSYLEKRGFLEMEGIYRVSGRQVRVEALKESYDKGKPIDFEAKQEDPYTCADLLLLFLRSLPEPLLAQPTAQALEAETERIPQLQALVFGLPLHVRAVLGYVCLHAARVVALEQMNKMGLKNVTIVFVPSLYCSPKLFATLVNHAKEIFSPPCSVCRQPLAIDCPPQSGQQLRCGSCFGESRGSGTDAGVGANNGDGERRRSMSASSALQKSSSGRAVDDGPKTPKSPLFRLSRAGSSVLAQGSGSGGNQSNTNSPQMGKAPPQAVSASASAAAGATGTAQASGSLGTSGLHVSSGGSSGAAGVTSATPPPMPPARSPRSEASASGSAAVAAGVVFGASLSSACKVQADTGVVVLPSVVRQCWRYVESNAAPRVYCVQTTNPSLVDMLQQRFDSGSKISLHDEVANQVDATNAVAALFKRYLSMLPRPLFTRELQPQFEQALAEPNVDARCRNLGSLVFRLSLETRTFLLHFISHLRSVVKTDAGKIEDLCAAFSTPCRCSAELLLAIYSNRRSIMQPDCSKCAKLIALTDEPKFTATEVLCKDCGGPQVH